ncbi:MAG: MarR family transcriptional regulator [Rubrivivax sp.]|nr:MarR family transcriptional regulator [Rubrivivax sp.]
MKTTAALPPIDLEEQPGHVIRRLHQIAVAIFLREAEDTGLTPVQYAVLQTVANQPGVDQRTLARSAGLDTSTIAGVVDRLEARELLVRGTTREDRRVRRLSLTGDGHALLAQAVPAMRRAQERILEPLDAAERRDFMRLMRKLVAENNEMSRAPQLGVGSANAS